MNYVRLLLLLILSSTNRATVMAEDTVEGVDTAALQTMTAGVCAHNVCVHVHTYYVQRVGALVWE